MLQNYLSAHKLQKITVNSFLSHKIQMLVFHNCKHQVFILLWLISMSNTIQYKGSDLRIGYNIQEIDL